MPSPPELLPDVFGQWCVKIIFKFDSALCRTERSAPVRRSYANQSRHGFSGLSDNYIFSRGDTLEQF